MPPIKSPIIARRITEKSNQPIIMAMWYSAKSNALIEYAHFFGIWFFNFKKAKPRKKNSSRKEFKARAISSEINVIGKNVDEACQEIDKYLDTCSLSGLATIRIVHGKGTGALRAGIHKFLKTHPHIKSFRVGTFGEGEMGVTIVDLK